MKTQTKTSPFRTSQGRGARTFRRKRVFGLGIAFVVVVGALLLGGAPTAFCLSRAEAALERADLSGAVRWTERAEGLTGRPAETAFWRARVERKLGRLDRASDSLRKAQSLGHDAESLKREMVLVSAQGGVLDDPQAQLSRLLASSENGRDVAEAFVRGDILTYRIDEALGLLDVWKKDLPSDPDARYLTGRLLEHRSDLAGAEAEFRAALKSAPWHAGAAYNLARVLLSAQKPKEALEQYSACAEHLYVAQPAEVGMARCLRELGRFDEARHVLEKASAAPKEKIEVACCIIGDPIAAAGAQLEEEWGRLELAVENWPAAEVRLRAALEASPRNWRIRYALATALRQQGEAEEAAEQSQLFEEAKTDLERCDRLHDALKADPSNADARYGIGLVLHEHVSEEQGIVWLRSALGYDPDHAGAHQALADIYEKKAAESSVFSRLAERHRAAAESAPSDGLADDELADSPQ